MDEETIKDAKRSDLTPTEWLEKYIDRKLFQNVSLNDEKYVEVRNFMLLWNIFEREFFYNEANAGRVWEVQNCVEPDRDVLNRYFHFLVDTYSVAADFKKLNFDYKKDNSYMPEHKYGIDVRKILKKDNPSIPERRQACLMIIWRYRNNLFHGGKAISDIWKQGVIFKEANLFLMSILSNKTGI